MLLRKLFRPVGANEQELIIDSGMKHFPARLHWQPILYPVLNMEYAIEIAERWNMRDPDSDGVGFVTSFEIPESLFMEAFRKMWGSYFSEIENHEHVWRVFAAIAMLLACLGLYGLATLNVSGRSKELSIRKVLGASLKNITRDISHPYLILFGAALLIGAPLSYLCNKSILELFYPYHIPVTWWSVSAASIMLVLVLLITVFTRIWKVSKESPLNGLKTE